jgi:hypothetical protein
MVWTQRPDLLARLDATADAVGGLRDIFAAEEPLDDVLDRVAASAVRAIPDADAVSVTVLTGQEPRTAAYTDARAVDIDKQQYVAGRGPCLEAARAHRPVRTVVGECEQWPEFGEAAGQAGVRASLSVPLLLDSDEGGDRELVGSLNIYSYTTAAFDPFDEGLMRVFSTAAEQAIANARRWQHSRDKVVQLETALLSRAEIDQAKGVLMAVHGCSADEAFVKLVDQSQRHNIKLNQLARNFLDSVRAAPGREATAP